MKKRIVIIILSVVCFAACTAPKSGDQKVTFTIQPAPIESDSLKHSSKEITDPVCGMVKDSTWTDYTLYKGDTVWFCAPSEKLVFEGNPKKYEANLLKH